ncbi:hypothetical protein GH714_000901 [Hevea brasiliensis]|uniref:Transposase MuDR plant domain-containing protein n=1 Tax=Hevea brasiliensis TaxID=3981 RepID=A0A6A6LR07_HEVBR|nr:hypothetical protein GH714_000901 [Hevea brasiliensis]
MKLRQNKVLGTMVMLLIQGNHKGDAGDDIIEEEVNMIGGNEIEEDDVVKKNITGGVRKMIVFTMLNLKEVICSRMQIHLRMMDDDLHSIVDSDCERDNEVCDFNEEVGLKDPASCKGMKFTNGHVFRKALREWALRIGYSYVLVKNNGFKITAVCKNKCGFRVHASKLRDCDTLQIKTFKPVHNCPREAYNHIVSSKYLAFKYLEEFRENPNWDVRAMQRKIQRELGIEISISKCYRAKNKAKAINDRDVREQFRSLLIDDFGHPDETGWVFMSDQQKGLIEAFKLLMPKGEHHFCVKHMYDNYKVLFKGLEYKKKLWGCKAGITGETAWQRRMRKKRATDAGNEEAHNSTTPRTRSTRGRKRIASSQPTPNTEEHASNTQSKPHTQSQPSNSDIPFETQLKKFPISMNERITKLTARKKIIPGFTLRKALATAQPTPTSPYLTAVTPHATTKSTPTTPDLTTSPFATAEQ